MRGGITNLKRAADSIRRISGIASAGPGASTRFELISDAAVAAGHGSRRAGFVQQNVEAPESEHEHHRGHHKANATRSRHPWFRKALFHFFGIHSQPRRHGKKHRTKVDKRKEADAPLRGVTEENNFSRQDT